MFTGIIEAQGIIKEITRSGSNKTYRLTSSLAPELRVDQSLSHDGVCLTVETVSAVDYTVTAIDETLSKTRLNQWKTGDRVNLERCLQMNGRLDGHIVQGHVDAVAVCRTRKSQDGSWVFAFEFPESFSHLVIEKGSIAVNGISLTCFDISRNHFAVAIIPYTFEHTNMKDLQPGSEVNIEFDMIGKYIGRFLAARG
jgi:riboflavin synthase